MVLNLNYRRQLNRLFNGEEKWINVTWKINISPNRQTRTVITWFSMESNSVIMPHMKQLWIYESGFFHPIHFVRFQFIAVCMHKRNQFVTIFWIDLNSEFFLVHFRCEKKRREWVFGLLFFPAFKLPVFLIMIFSRCLFNDGNNTTGSRQLLLIETLLSKKFLCINIWVFYEKQMSNVSK